MQNLYIDLLNLSMLINVDVSLIVDTLKEITIEKHTTIKSINDTTIILNNGETLDANQIF